MTLRHITRTAGTTVIGGLLLASLAIGLSAANGGGVAEARGRRADDSQNEIRGGHGADDTQPDDRGGQRRNGSDDTQVDDKGGHGADDGPNHS